MRTGKELFNTLLVELNEMGLPGMSSTLDEMYRSPKFLELDPLTAIANLVQPEYQKKMNKRIQSVCAAPTCVGARRSSPIAWIPATGNICPVALPERCLRWTSLTQA